MFSTLCIWNRSFYVSSSSSLNSFFLYLPDRLEDAGGKFVVNMMPLPKTEFSVNPQSLGILVDIDLSKTAQFLLGRLSCFCGVLAGGKGLELVVGILKQNPHKNPLHFGKLEKYCQIRFC